MGDLKNFWRDHGGCLYPTYLAMDKAMSEWNPKKPAFKLKRAPRNVGPLSLEEIDSQISGTDSLEQREVLEEYRAARAFQLKTRGQAEQKERERQLEEENFEQAKAEGNIAECGCCFVEYAMNRMVHCDGQLLHVSRLPVISKCLLMYLFPI